MTTNLAAGCICDQCEPGCQNDLYRPCCEACLNPNAWPTVPSSRPGDGR